MGMRYRLHDLLVFTVGFAAFVILCPTLGEFLDSADQCHPLAFIENVKAGEIVYKDFMLQFPPGISYLAYAVMHIFNNNFVGYILLICLGNALVSWLVYKIACELNGTLLAYVSLVLSVILHPPLYKWYLCAFPLVSILIYIKYLQASIVGKSRFSLIAASAAFAGLGAYFRMDTAAYNVAAMIGGQGAFLYLSKRHPESFQDKTAAGVFLRVVQDTVVFLAVFALTLAPFFVLGVKYDFLTSVWESLVVPTAGMPGAMGLPYPSLATILQGVAKLKIHLLLFYVVPLTLLVYLFSTAFQVLLYRNGGDLLRVPVAIFGVLLLLQAAHRSDFPHILQVATPFWIVFPAMITPVTRVRRATWSVGWLLALLAISFAVISKDAAKRAAVFSGISNKLSQYMIGPPSLPNHPVSRLVEYVQANSSQNHQILVVSHSVQIHYFAHRKFAGGLVDYVPWKKQIYVKVLDRLESERGIIDMVISLENFRFDGREERSLRVFAPTIHKFTVDNFCCTKRIGSYVILMPRVRGRQCTDKLDCSF